MDAMLDNATLKARWGEARTPGDPVKKARAPAIGLRIQAIRKKQYLSLDSARSGVSGYLTRTGNAP